MPLKPVIAGNFYLSATGSVRPLVAGMAYQNGSLKPLIDGLFYYGASADGIPINVSPPVVSPTAVSVGMVVSCNNGSWTDSPNSFAFQWMADGTPIGGATSNTYTAVLGDVGAVLSCEVTASNSFGPSAPEVSNDTDPVTASSDFTYFRPGGVDTYHRPGGVDIYIRP